MAAKRKKTKRARGGPAVNAGAEGIAAAEVDESLDPQAGAGGSVPPGGERAQVGPPANGPVRGRAGVGRGQAAPQARRYAFRRS